ncbi:immunoglobulin A1 protease [Streptococcus pneumoniae]|nr:immunoglobulin A1 protease [Streptococcus pneumoniae]VND49699.1 immunoglobulin A1 protease [Streptococcus pneumoniae]VNY07088.1 immunoglobulin A1 protease [Streptococcus pneumoniae]VOZ56800.1 immunoglobulin A1 protease [Streptococcus pneumoniae]VPI66793.1 immunoglobulin A1 protease [Streptococcus pneumoniae]
MEKYFGEKQERFSFRKLSVGLVSATISSLFFMSVLASSSVDAQETAGVHYKYVADSELSSEEKKQLVYDIPTYVENDDETYYLVYKLNSQNQLAELPNTGSKNERQALVAGASLAALGILIFAVSKKKVKNKTVLHLVLVAGIGNGVLVSVHALENHLLLNYNTDYELTSGEKLPLPKEISGYTYIGYIKEGKTTSDFEVSNQEKSAATPTKQQKVDYNVTPNFVDHPSTVQAIQEQTPVSSTKPTEVQVVEKPFSTKLINPRKEEKQSSDSQEQLAEHKNLETKKEEKISPKEKTGVNTLNPQDEVLSGQLNKPELLYREETIETKIDFQEEIQENPDLAEGTVRVKQEGKLGKKVEIVRIFSVNKEEVSREIVSTSTTAPSPRIVEKGTKKTQVIKEQPETGVEHKDVQSGAIVEPAIQPELPEAVVSDKGVPEVQPALSEAVVTDKGEPAVQPELPEAVVSDKGEPEQVAPLPEYTGVQAGAIVEPAVQPALPEAVVSDKGVPEVQPELPEAVVSDKGVPEVQPELPEAVVSDKGVPEVQPELPEAVVSDKGEPEQVAPLPEYKGNIEQVKPETPVEKLQEEEPEKTIELRSVSDVELYSYEANQSKQHTILDKVPDNKSAYFIKVKSAKFKDVLLPVSNIEDTTKDGKVVYKITARLEHLKQSVDNQYQDNFTYYLPKVVQNDGPIYTSFKKLVTDMNSRPDGTFILGATMNAREFELGENQESYVTKNFTGTLIGSHQGKHYAIYNLKKPLFNTLNNAAIQDLTLKDVNISGKNHVASVAMEATNSSTLDNVHANGIIAGELGIGGLVQKVDNSTVRNSSFTGRITNTFVTTSQYAIGGLVGQLTGANARVAHSISTVVISSNGEHSNQTIGGIVGIVENNATVENSYAEGEINNAKPFARVGGVAGSLWTQEGGTDNNTGRLTNVLSDMNITNGNAISGYHFNGIKETNVYSNKENKVVNVQAVGDEVMSVDSTVERGTEIEKTSVQAKKDEITKKHTITVEDFTNSVKQDVDYTKAAHYQSTREVAYKNIEKLLPFYNRDTIVKYGNQLSTDHNLFKKELLSVVAMKNDEVVSDITSNKNSINHLLLHYKDGTSEKVDLTYNSDFANLAEYNIENTGLVYTPNAFLKNYTPIIDRVKNDLTAVPYNPTALKNLLGISDNVKLTELYLDEQFTKTKEHLTETLKKLLSADAAVSGNNDIIDNYIVDKIKRNKEALMLGLTYLERWYDFKFDKASAKDLLMFHMDFFGKGNTSPLDAIIELGKSGYNNLLAKNNVVTYNALLTNNYGTKDLFSALEGYRKAFAPHQTNNEWFKSQTKAYIVEEKSNIEEVKTKQGLVGTKYSIGVYDRITSATWKYRNMVLPLLTLPEKSVFVISTISSLGFGAYDRYRNSEHKAGKDLNDFVEENARETAKRQRDHYDYWYRILDDNAREKLYRNILLYDAYKFGDDNTVGKATEVADFDNPNPAMQHFFGPVGNKVGHNQHGAYATGDAVYYMGYRMLDKDGAITYTHEMTHDSDQDIYLGGYGRRSGLGPEFFAKGLLQAPDHPDDATITINSILKHSKSDSIESRRLQVLDPTTRFNNADDLKQYVHNMFDVVYMLEYLEGNSILKLDTNQKQQLLRKVTNEYHPDPDGNKVYATNVVRNLTVEEVERLRSFNDLIDNNILSAREYKAGTYERNGYYTIKLFAPIYSALSSEKGTPGDLMGRRIAYELLAAKGFKDGMVPYISNQYEEDAKQQGQTINLYGKERGLVTDELVLKKVFDGKYKTWAEFKTAMYQERVNQFGNLKQVAFKDPTKRWPSYGTKTINNVDELQALMDQAVLKDAEGPRWSNYDPEIDSAVHKLKRAIFKAYLDQTNDFRSSIFENKK